MSNPDFRADFPILQKEVRGKPLVYLDNAATTQKPQAVIDRLGAFFEGENANIHRGVHFLSMGATDAYDRARAKVAGFLGAAAPEEIVFTRGTTESINLVARSFGGEHLGEGDEVLLTEMEHHANIVPWQMIARERGAKLVVAPVTDRGEVDLESFGRLLTDRTKIATFIHVSNVLGTVNPVGEMVALAKGRGATTVVDGAQAVAHEPVDVSVLGADFYAFSSHKLFGPDGVGVLYGRRELLEAMQPYQGGGDMIERVSFSGTTFRGPPERFEAGTPNISGAIGLGVAIDYLAAAGWDAITEREHHLGEHAGRALREVPGLTMIGDAPGKAPVFSFTLEDIHPHDVGTVLDTVGVAVRTGHHCAQPLMRRLGIVGTTRASLAFYNNDDDIHRLVEGLHKVRSVLAP